MFRNRLAGLMNHLMLSCAEVTARVSASLDRDLPPHQRLRMRLHLFMCALCRRYREQVLFLREALRSHSERLENQETPPPAGLSPEARTRIKEALALGRK